jgi:hypothetical protein
LVPALTWLLVGVDTKRNSAAEILDTQSSESARLHAYIYRALI